MCRCMCRRCTNREVQSVGTQTDWNRKVKAVQATRRTAAKGISCKPNYADAAIGVGPVTVDSGVDPILPYASDLLKSAHTESDISTDSSSESETEDASQNKDSDYVPNEAEELETVSGSQEMDQSSTSDADAKFLVFGSKLRDLFNRCPQCGAITEDCNFSTENTGTLLTVTYRCSNGHTDSWLSQPLLRHRMAAGNLLLSASILIAGLTYERVREMAEILRMPIMCESHFYSIQDSYLFPVIHSVYSEQKEAFIAALGDNPLTLVGDGRCDSPGFSAKYGTYSIMETTSGKVVTFALKQVNADTTSVGMEVEGCYDSLNDLRHHGINVEVFGTDCSSSVAKLMRETFPNILHEHDVYHIEKRIRKKLTQKANQRGNTILHGWVKPVVNQLWWVAQNCNQNKIELREKWISMIYHVTNKHSWDHFDIYHACAHTPLREDEARKKKWLISDSSPHCAFKEVVMDKRLVSDIEKLTRAVHTGNLESYHSLINKYCPKRQHFSFKGMLIRTELAILDLNNNLSRQQATTKEGVPRFSSVYPKRTKEWVAKRIAEPKSCHWRLHLLHEVLRFKQGERHADPVPVPDDIPQNIADSERPPKEEVIARFRSRFAATSAEETNDSDSPSDCDSESDVE